MNFLPFSKLIVLCFLVFPFMNAFSAEENFLLINGLTNKTIIEMGCNIHRRLSPCSTFKIPLSLMGYDAGILENETNPTWEFQEGYEEFLATWKNSHNPLSWMNTSCVWYSKILSLELGLKKIQTYLAFMEYGNQDISTGLVEPGPQSPFWIRRSLKISLTEQVHFIQKMFCVQTPLSSHAIQMTKRLLFKEELPNGNLWFMGRIGVTFVPSFQDSIF